MTAMVISGVIAAAVAVTQGVMAYQKGKAEKRTADAQAKAAKEQANADAQEQERQARMENARAGVSQIGAEQEAEKRSRQMAQDIGSMYANFAGNGLMTDGSGKDSVGMALRTEAKEAESDITTIRDNAAMDVWTHRSNAASLRASAANRRIAGHNESEIYRAQGRTAAQQGRWGLGVGIASGIGALVGSVGKANSGGGGGNMA